MVLTEKDLLEKPRPIKTPKTLNPLGAMLQGVILAETIVILNNTFIAKNYNVYLSILGIILSFISIAIFATTISLTAKSVFFFMTIEKNQEIKTHLARQSVLFYIGFVPTFGFLISYGAPDIVFWKFFVAIGVVCIFFTYCIWQNIMILRKEEARIGNLLEWKYQPKKVTLILISFIPILITTLMVLLIPN